MTRSKLSDVAKRSCVRLMENVLAEISLHQNRTYTSQEQRGPVLELAALNTTWAQVKVTAKNIGSAWSLSCHRYADPRNRWTNDDDFCCAICKSHIFENNIRQI